MTAEGRVIGNGAGVSPDALDTRIGDIAAVVPPPRRELVQNLARSALRRASAAELAGLDPAATAARLHRLLDFMDGREAGGLALRVRAPARDEGTPDDATVIEVNVDDSPFLLTTVTEELSALDLHVSDLLHPVVGVERDADGRLLRLLPARTTSQREAVFRLEVRAGLDEAERDRVAAALRGVLGDALAATRDFADMRERADALADDLVHDRGDPSELAEVAAFLRWLLDDHFVWLGYRRYDIVDVDGRPAVVAADGSGLGILSRVEGSGYAEPIALDDLAEGLREQLVEGPPLVVSRTNRKSTVHRRQRMVYLGIRRRDADGRVTGEHRFLGLFAQKAFAQPASTIPVLRGKLEAILDAEDVVDHSYDERALRGLFEAIPKHELFEAEVEGLRRSLVGLLEAQKTQDVRVLLRLDERQRNLSVLVALPRERFNARVRQRTQGLLVDRFAADGVDYHLSLTERDQALLHFILHAGTGARIRFGGSDTTEVVDELSRAVVALTRTWADDLRTALQEELGDAEGRRLSERYREVLPPGYTDTTPPSHAVADVLELEELARGEGERAVRVNLQRRDDDAPGVLRFKVYKIGGGIELSSFLPILESLGFVVIEEVPHRLLGHDIVGELHLHDFGVRSKAGQVDVDHDGQRLADAARAMWAGRAIADSLNELVVVAGLGWREVAVLRAYRRYRRQVGTSFTEAYLNAALVDHPAVARALMRLFRARFDPDVVDRDVEVESARAAVVEACDAVQRLDQDRILRGWLALLEATLRTNYYRADPERPFLAFKIDSAQVPGIPKPVPHVEIFVYSPAMEGVHLRGDKVARGGLRWSDRKEDFRTEVLGLMKAQMTKNAVIVPSGSKGGFVLKQPPADPSSLRDEVRRQYQVFIRGLLDLTDDIDRGDVRHPPRVVRWDGDDPYLVVAADRGTATFSDVANAISAEYGFWLGDAFASGGSRGYDHKAMGITARGAWVAVQRHFRELDLDVQRDPVSVVGIGDMSGDVFGNGLLRSRSVRLVAAFDHRDIFLDPSPDAGAAYDERRRLFELPRSSWQDYDRTLLSEGGGVWSREVKEIHLSPQVRELLRIDAERVSPPELIQMILRAPADLLFAGGIGTFVKASHEDHADAGDRANDAIRVDADELGARVVGEGANLSLTQDARIQYARRGGRCNTDAIDNSAGVDTSDREVNLKILLRLAQEREGLGDEDRDGLLAEMTDDVAAAVLRDVYLQTWAVSQELADSPGGLEAYEALMVDLVETGRFDRDVERLPDSAEMRRRAASGAGLVRPELAVLLGWSKVDLSQRLLASRVPDEPALADVIAVAFPALAVQRFGHLLGEHELRRELIATVLANDIVNRMGITYVSRTAHELGSMAWEVAAAYWTAREVVGADELWRLVERLDNLVPPVLQLELKAKVDHLVDSATRWYLRVGDLAQMGSTIARDRAVFAELAEEASRLGTSRRRAGRAAEEERYIDLGVPGYSAARLVTAAELALVPEVAAVARSTGADPRRVANVFLHLGEALPLERLQRRLDEIEDSGHWERWQHRQLVDELRDVRRDAAASLLEGHGAEDVEVAVRSFLDERSGVRARVASIVDRIDREGGGGLPAVAVAVRALRLAVAR